MSTPIQMQLSLKQKTFSAVFNPVLESTSNFKHFEKMLIVVDTLLRKLQTLKELLIPLSKKHRFITPFESQHFKGSLTPAKHS